MNGPIIEDPMSFEEAVLILRNQADQQQLLYDSFLDADLEGGGERFFASDEFAEVLRFVGQRVLGGVVVDVGAGTGIASFAFARAGAQRVYAVEPDLSDIVGVGAIRRLTGGLPVEIVSDWGESIGLPDAVADIVYARQVLHHARDLESFVAECARLVKPGGIFVASREHVVTDSAERAEFLSNHVIHRLTGSEGAFELWRYEQAIQSAGLKIKRVYGPLDSVVNTYPGFSSAELAELPRKRWRQKLGGLGALVADVPVASSWMMKRIARNTDPAPGRLYTFVAAKPSSGVRA